MYFFRFNSFKKGKTGCLCRAEPADMWRGHVSPRGRLLDAYVACTITGWQLMGPRVRVLGRTWPKRVTHPLRKLFVIYSPISTNFLRAKHVAA